MASIFNIGEEGATHLSPAVADSALPVGAQWRMVGALTAIAMLALLDKNVLSLLVEPLKISLHLTDAKVGLAVGAAFAVAHIAIGIPAGWMADRFDRRRIIFGGVILWSAMAALCGLATNFWQFFIARAGVGLGEGLIPPASYALIRDGVEPRRQGRAFSVFAMSNTLGPGTAMLLGGALIALIAAFSWNMLPLVGPVEPWQLTLIILGVGGFPLAFLAFAFPDPQRRSQRNEPSSFRDALAIMRARRAIFVPLTIFSCASAMVANTLGIWFAAFVGRTFGLPPSTIGATIGLLLVVAGPLGLLCVGSAIDFLAARNKPGVGRVTLVFAILLFLFSTSMPLSTSLPMLWTLEAGVLLSSTAYLAIVSTTVSATTPGNMVGKVMAIMLVLQGLFGSGLSPVLTGLVADHIFTGPRALGNALSLVCGTLSAIGLLAALVLARSFEREREIAL
jgi:MFS family permease